LYIMSGTSGGHYAKLIESVTGSPPPTGARTAGEPRSLEVEVVAAGRWADSGQLRVDSRTVVALLVVLDDDLPVGGELIRVSGDDRQVFGPVCAHNVLEPRDVLGEICVAPARVASRASSPGAVW
jgi:hypothetical protein